MAPNILKSSLEDASFNIVFQIMCRCLTFFLNAFVIRHVGEAVLGVMNVRLLLLESIILFLSKEPFLRAGLTNTAEHNWAQVVNLLWMSVPLSVVISTIGGYVWLNHLSMSEDLPAFYSFAVWAIAISCVIELSSLVIQLVASAFLFVKLKIILDSLMIALRTIVFILFIIYNPENALLAFGVAQLVAAIFYTGSLYYYFHHYMKNVKRHKLKRRLSKSDDGEEEYVLSEFPFHSIKDFLPGQLPNQDFILNRKLSILTWSFFKQGFLKQILTEVERLIMTFLPVLKFTEQGTYEIVNNLGSLAARFIFRPIENSSYFYFSQMVKRDEPISLQNPAKIKESVDVLSRLCSTISSFGLIVLVFGYAYSPLLLWLYGGSKLTTLLPVQLMRAHCLAVLLLGINGVTECYVNATADNKTINKNNRIMLVESIVFPFASYIFTRLFGPVGFIIGNCLNMGIRIAHSTIFIEKRYSNTSYKPLKGIFPTPIFSISLIISAIVTNLSNIYFFAENKFLHLCIGMIMFSIVLLSWIIENYSLIKVAINKFKEWRNNRQKNE